MKKVIINDGWHDDFEYSLGDALVKPLVDQNIIYPVTTVSVGPDSDTYAIVTVLQHYEADGGETTVTLTTDQALERFEEAVERNG